MIQVGKHENLVLTKVTKNDQGTLVVGFRQMTDIDPLAALSGSGQTSFDKPEQDFLIYPPKAEAYGGGPDNQKNLLAKIAEVKNPLDHIASVYMPVGARKWDPFKNTGIELANMERELNKQPQMDKVYANIVEQFIAMMTPYVGESGKRVRMIFPRQSAAKHFPALRKRFLDSQPFIEPMDIPATDSKLSFSKYEKEKGLDNPHPVSAPGAPTSQEDKEKAAAMFK